MDLQAEINQKEKELKLLKKKQKKQRKALVIQTQIVTIFGIKYSYEYSHSYEEGGDIYNIKPCETQKIFFNRATDETKIFPCQLLFEGNTIEISKTLSQWNSRPMGVHEHTLCVNSSKGVSGPNESEQWCRIKKGKFEIDFTYFLDIGTLVPTRFIYNNSWN